MDRFSPNTNGGGGGQALVGGGGIRAAAWWSARAPGLSVALSPPGFTHCTWPWRNVK